MAPVLHLDLETRSSADLKKVGAHRYAEDPSTSIILASYRFDKGPVQRWIGEDVPTDVINYVCSGGPVAGHNQQFERVLWNARIAPQLPRSYPPMQPEQQDCTMSRAAAAGLPHSLDNLGNALNLAFKKDKAGHALMMKMCKPKTRDPLTWHEEPADVVRLAAYCDQDVETECDADAHLAPLTERERQVWILDQEINDRGFAVDLPLVQACYAAVLEAQKRADTAMWKLTNGAVKKATQTKKLAEWVSARGVPCTSVADDGMDELLVAADLMADPDAEAALRLRRNSAGAFKFEAMLRCVCSDGRIRGSLQYHGTHGGRWSGRVVQPHNFKRIDTEEEGEQVLLALDLLRQFGHDAGQALDAMEMLLDLPVLEVLTLCARPMIIARPGHWLLDADFSNIEGRLNAWFAGEHWKLEAFAAYDRGEGPDLYKVTAAGILEKDVADIRKEERQENGKVPELACGYQGGYRALQKQAAKVGLTLATGRARQIVEGWRATNPAIVESWAELQEAAIDAVRAPGMMVSCLGGKVRYLKPVEQDFLWCCLPSGRVISYAAPRLGWSTKYFTSDGEMIAADEVREMEAAARADLDEVNNYGLTFWGQKSGRWMKLDLYGGMQCAHIVSGTARDLLVEAMFAVEAAGYPIILTVHDEKLAEVPLGFGSVEHFKATIIERIAALPWMRGLPLAVSAWGDTRYVK